MKMTLVNENYRKWSRKAFSHILKLKITFFKLQKQYQMIMEN